MLNTSLAWPVVSHGHTNGLHLFDRSEIIGRDNDALGNVQQILSLGW